jgi:ribosomal protein S18 acetylase RimI-like enzyme
VPSIELFQRQHATAFDALNRAWLVEHGLIEAADEPHLRDPYGTIIAVGGQAFVAIEDENVIGTCAIVPHGPGEFELVKLAVAPEAQGRGIGRQLIDACVSHARTVGAKRLTLLSSTRLGAALRLYERAGFRHAPLPASNPYVTADVHMVLEL